jgi:TolA-binding protein
MRRTRSGAPLLLALTAIAGAFLPAAAAVAAAPAPSGAAIDDDRPLDVRTYSQGMEALRAGRRDEAARLLRRVFTDFPQSPQAPSALLEMARLIYPVTDWGQMGSATPQAIQQAAELLNRLSQKYRGAPEAARALVLLGYLGLEPANAQGNLDEACGRFSTAAQMYPDNEAAADAFFASGMCDALRARPARAADDFSRLLEERPDSALAPEALYRYGAALSLLGDPAEAMLALQSTRARYPDSPFAGRALELQTLLHRLRVLPALVAKARPGAATGLDWTLLYRPDAAYGASQTSSAANAIRGISDISIDAQGLAVVASPRTPGVFRLDARGRVQEQINHPGPDHISAAEGLAVYITGREQIAVNARNWSGTDLKGPTGRPPADYGPIAVDSAGRVHLLDRRENAILIYDRARRLTGAVRPPGGKEGRFVDVAPGNEGGVYALDARAKAVIALHQGRETGRTDLTASGVQEPIALAVDGIGDLYVLDSVTRAVAVCDPDGRLITLVRPPKEMLLQIGEPSTLAVDALGRIYLAGRKTGRVGRFQ